MTQTARPDSDIETSGWAANGGPATLYECIDEAVTDDDDYISSSTDNADCEVGLSNVTDPASAASHVITVRVKKSVTGTVNSITVALVENTTVRASFQPTLTTSFADQTYTLSAAEADSITDYTNLRLRFTLDISFSGTGSVSQAYFQVPDAAAVPLAGTAAGNSGATAQASLLLALQASGGGSSGAIALATILRALVGEAAASSGGSAAISVILKRALEIDWDNDGDYSDTGEDVTARVRGNPGITIERGRDQIRALSPPMVGAASVELDNQSKDYSPENSGSPLYGNLLTRRRGRYYRSLEGTTYYLFDGYVDDIIQHPEQSKRSTAFTFLDGLSKLRGQKISTPLYQNIRIDQAIGYLLDAVAEKLDIAGATVGNMSKWGTAVLGTATFGSYGFLGNERVFDTAKTTLRFWWLADEDAFDALVKLLATEGPGSLVYVDGQGRVRFESRHYRILTTRCTTSQATLDEVSTSEPAWSQLSYDSRLKDVINYCDAEVKTREVATTRSVVWSLGHSLSIGPSESVTITASGSNPFTGAITPVPGTDYTLENGSCSVSMNRSSGANAEITIKAGASGATISGLQLRAYAVAVARTKTIKSTIDATTSQTRYGERKYTLSLLPEINEHVAQDLVNAVVSMYQSPRSMVSVGMINKNDTRLAQQLGRELSDRITVVDSQTGLNGDLWIERVAHEITDNYKVHRTVFGCEKVYAFPSTSKWGTATLGTAVFGA